MCRTDSKNLITSRVTNPLAPFIIIIKRKGIIFCTTLTQTSLMMLIFLIRLINHRWNGAIPNFIIATRILSIFNSLIEIIKLIDRIENTLQCYFVLDINPKKLNKQKSQHSDFYTNPDHY